MERQRLILGIVGALFCLTTFSLFSVYGSDGQSCTRVLVNNGTSYSCTDYLQYDGIACFGIQIQSTDVPSQYSTYIETMTLTCSWSEGTVVVGSIAVAVGIGFLIVYAFIDVKPSLWVAGLVSTVGLLLAVVVMIVDMANGQTYFNNTYTQNPEETQTTENSTDIGGFVANIVIAFVTFVIMAIATSKAQKIGKEGGNQNTTALMQQNPQHPQFIA